MSIKIIWIHRPDSQKTHTHTHTYIYIYPSTKEDGINRVDEQIEKQ